MASSTSIPAPEAVQVLVTLLADDSSTVRDASMSSLKDISALNPLLVLECCAAVSRGGRRRFGNMAGVFQVMAFGVRALDKRDVDPAFMAKLAKIATAEMISSKGWKDIFGFNLAAMDHIQQMMASRSDAPFRDARSKLLEIRTQQSKRLEERSDTGEGRRKKRKTT